MFWRYCMQTIGTPEVGRVAKEGRVAIVTRYG